MKHQTARKWMCSLLLVGFCVVITALACQALLRGFACFFVGVGLALGGTGLLVACLYLRCPYCRSLLPLWEESAAACPHCGKRLEGGTPQAQRARS